MRVNCAIKPASQQLCIDRHTCMAAFPSPDCWLPCKLDTYCKPASSLKASRSALTVPSGFDMLLYAASVSPTLMAALKKEAVSTTCGTRSSADAPGGTLCSIKLGAHGGDEGQQSEWLLCMLPGLLGLVSRSCSACPA